MDKVLEMVTRVKFMILNVFLIKSYQIYFKIKLIYNKEIIVIHSIGKVGSSSLYNSLKKRNFIVHTHFFHEKNINFWSNYYQNSPRKSIPLHLYRSDALRRELRRFKQIKIITPFREPISREYSSLFQDNILFPSLVKGDINEASLTLKKIGQRLSHKLPEENWIDLEIQKFFQIDLFSQDFDETKKYLTYKKGNISLLVFRLEDVDIIYPVVLSNFIGQNLAPLKVTNTANKKIYSQAYTKLSTKPFLSKDQFEKIKNQKFYLWLYQKYQHQAKIKWVK